MEIIRLPLRRGQFKMPKFAAWLAQQGAEVGKPTNPYEVIRYRAYTDASAKAVTHVVYSKENGNLTFTGESRRHYEAFLANEIFPGMFRSPLQAPMPGDAEVPPRVSDAAKRRAKLLMRDGEECWFCGVAMGDDVTIEHLVPKSKGGGNRLENFALAHKACNALAADKPLVAKIELRARLREAAALSRASGETV